jgi:hypothetical protein
MISGTGPAAESQHRGAARHGLPDAARQITGACRFRYQKRMDIRVKMFLPQNEGDSRLMFPEKQNRPQIEMQTARDVEDAAHRELGAASTLLVGGTQRLSEFIRGAEG